MLVLEESSAAAAVDESIAAAGEVDVTKVVGADFVELELELELELDVSTARVLMNTESCAVLLVAVVLVLVPAPGNVTEISEGKMLNERISLDAGAVERASAAGLVVMGTIAAREDGASEPVIVVMEGFVGGVDEIDPDVEREESEVVVSVFGGTTIVCAAPGELEDELELELGAAEAVGSEVVDDVVSLVVAEEEPIDVRPFGMAPVVVNTSVFVSAEVELLLSLVVVDAVYVLRIEVNPGGTVSVFVIVNPENSGAEVEEVLSVELVDVDVEASIGIELSPLIILPVFVCAVSVGCRLKVVKPPVGPLKVAEAVTKIMTILLGLGGVEVDDALAVATAGVSNEAVLGLEAAEVSWLAGTMTASEVDAVVAAVLLFAALGVGSAATENSASEVEVCADTLLESVMLELSSPASEIDSFELALSVVVVTGASVFSGGNGCVTRSVVSTVAMIVVSMLTVTGVGCAASKLCEVTAVTVESRLGNAGIGIVEVDCGSGTSDIPDSSCLLRNSSSDPPVSPLTIHLRCSSLARRKTLLLLPLKIGPAELKAINKSKLEVEMRILVDS